MSDASNAAYAETQRLIAEAKANGATSLRLDTSETRALTNLPREIAELNALTRLDLESTQISDLSPIAGLRSLTTLLLTNTQITDLSPIAGLTALTELYLSNTQIADLGPIAGLTAVTALFLSNTQIADLSPIAVLTALTELHLSNSQITDLSPIAGLTALTALVLSNTQIADLSPVAGLTALTELYVSNTQITDLSPIAGLTALTALVLSDTQIADLSPVAGLTALTDLYLSNSQITVLSPVAGLTALTTLVLSDTQIADLSPVAGLTALTTLDLRNTQIVDLSPIAGLINLERLNLDLSLVSEVAALGGLTSLITLDLHSTAVTDVAPIAALASLRSLNLDASAVLDLRPLSEMQAFVSSPARFTSMRMDRSGKLVEHRNSGLSFWNSAAAKADRRVAEIADIDNASGRAYLLFDYLKGWVPPEVEGGASIETALQGPILSETLADITKPDTQFEATSLVDEPERDADRNHDDLLATMRFAAARLARTDAQNKIGKAVVESFADYSQFSAQTPLNPRVLNYLANGIRVAIADDFLSASLDAFDKTAISGFLGEHDAFIRDYYPSSLTGPTHDVEASTETLVAELFPKLASAKEILKKADDDGLFAPSVSDALEMLERRAEGARRKLATSIDPGELKLADQDLRRNSVLVTAYLGRITGRLKQWLIKQAAKAQEDPVDGALRATGMVDAAKLVVETLKPVFDYLWQLIGNIPLPF